MSSDAATNRPRKNHGAHGPVLSIHVRNAFNPSSLARGGEGAKAVLAAPVTGLGVLTQRGTGVVPGMRGSQAWHRRSEWRNLSGRRDADDLLGAFGEMVGQAWDTAPLRHAHGVRRTPTPPSRSSKLRLRTIASRPGQHLRVPWRPMCANRALPPRRNAVGYSPDDRGKRQELPVDPCL